VEFLRLYNATNDLKRVMRAFSNSEGQPILSWSVIDQEIKKLVELDRSKPVFLQKEVVPYWEPRKEEYQKFSTTVWDVPRRGSWGVHQPTYRGNWAPQIPRALLEHYSNPGDLVLDPFVGGGTTLIESWVLGRPAIGYDVSQFALDLATARLNELDKVANRESLFGLPNVRVEIRKGDARTLEGIEKETIDFICTHPPYGDALEYTHSEEADLSQISDPALFMDALENAGRRFFEVLKPRSYCALLIGDLRRERRLHTLGFETAARFRSIGFDIEDVVIKTQNQDRSTEFYYRASPVRLRLSHEYLLILQKPA
jgi:SAM-dependent methyltransferase